MNRSFGSPTKLSLSVHGGAWDIPDNLVEVHRRGVRTATEAGWQILIDGGSAVEAVEAAVVILENDEVFDAGRGSFMNAAGEVELDAGIMDGRILEAGAVAAVQNVRNPVTLARRVMEKSEHVLLVGRGATRFARENGIPLCGADDLIVDREINRWREIQRMNKHSIRDVFRARQLPGDTVGAIALDRSGNVASATSTGGVPHKYPGRVGDSPLIGSGIYADNQGGAVSVSGWGEAIIRVVLAKTVTDLMALGRDDPAAAAEKGISVLRKRAGGYGAVIAMNPEGKIGIAYNTPRMARGIMNLQLDSPEILV